MKRIRKSISYVLTVVMLISFVCSSGISFISNAESGGQWMSSSKGWWYKKSDGSCYTSSWQEIDGLWYHFDSDGYVTTGWISSGGSWYYCLNSGAMVYSGWCQIEGKWYFFNEDGTMQTGWLKVGDYWYYFKSAGNMLTGWVLSDGNYYYCDRSTGIMRTNYTVNGIHVGSNGKAETSGYDSYKIDTMILADDIVDSYVTATASETTQINECCEYVMQYPYHQYRTLKPIMDTDYWAIEFARDIFDNKQGCCVSEAAALAFLFTELNIGTAYVDHDTGHAWTEINGRYYDPLFAESKGRQYLNMSPSDYYTSNPVGWYEI